MAIQLRLLCTVLLLLLLTEGESFYPIINRVFNQLSNHICTNTAATSTAAVHISSHSGAVRSKYFDAYSSSTSVTATISGSIPSLPPQQQPLLPLLAPRSKLPIYKDNIIDKVSIFFLSLFLSQHAANPREARKLVFIGMDFKNFVTLTKTFMRESSPLLLRQRIVNLLKSVLPPLVRSPFRMLYRRFPKWFCEKCSLWMSLNLMTWLVGPSERIMLDINASTTPSIAATSSIASITATIASDDSIGAVAVADPITQLGSDLNITQQQQQQPQQLWRSGVKLVECRYLMEAGCKANCLHLCKGPTQQFFAQELGVPLYMKPNFTDSSCELQFGVTAPAQEDDPAYKESCFTDCPAAKFKGNIKC